MRGMLLMQVIDAEIFPSRVRGSGLLLPGVFPDVGVLRQLHTLDAVSHSAREKSFRNLKYQRGKLTNHDDFLWLKD